MEYNNTGYEREIDLKELMFVVLRQWRLLLAAAVAMAFLFGGYKAVSTWFREFAPKESVDSESKYKKEMEYYEQKLLAGEREVENLTDSIERQREYLAESVFINMSPYDIWEAKADFFVETDYEIMPGMAYQNRDFTATVLQTYQSALSGTDFIEEAAEFCGIQARYLKELVTISIGRSDEGYNNLLSIQIRHREEGKAKELLEKYIEGVYQYREKICSSIREHTITEVNRSLGAQVDLGLADRQRSERAQLDSLMENLAAKEESLDALKKEEVPQKDVPAVGALVKTGVKYGILGGFMGIFGVMFFICIHFVMSDKVSSARELKYRFQFRILGNLPDGTSKKGINPIDAWLSKLEGRPQRKDINREYDLIAVNILNAEEKTGPIFLTGGAVQEKIDDVAENLGKRLPDVTMVSGGNFLSDPESLKKLPQCGCVVLVEQCGVSSYGDTELEIEKIRDLNKKLAGCILIGS